MPMAIESTVDKKLERFGLTEGDVERLVEALGSKNQHVRHVVRGALRGLGCAAVPVLEKALAGRDAGLRGEVSDLLRQVRG